MSEVLAHIPRYIFRNLIPKDIPRPLNIENFKNVSKGDIQGLLGFKAVVRLEMQDRIVTWEARFSRFGETDPNTGAVGVYVAVDDPYLKTQPGTRPPLEKNLYCEVELRGKARPPNIIIPRSALREGTVYVANADNRLEIRAVTVDFSQADLVSIKSGLKANERVVVDALNRVDEELTPLQPEERSLVRNINVQFNKNQDAFEIGSHVATVSVDLLKAEKRNARIDAISQRWREELGNPPDVITISFKEPVIGPGGLPIDIRLQGTDLTRLKSASLELQNWLKDYEGILEIYDDLRPGKPEIQARLKSGALAKGIDASSIANQLRAAFFGKKADQVQVGSESYEIDVRLAQVDQNSLADLEYFHVTTPDGEQVPLGSVAILEQTRGVARIARINSARTVTILGDVDTNLANAGEIIADTKNKFLPELQSRYPEITFSLEGQAKESAKTGTSMVKAFLLGMFGLYVILIFQFRSYLQSLMVMSAIPLSLIGVIWGHLLMGLDFSMVSMMGFISLSGVVINDSILLVEFIRIGMLEGKEAGLAAKAASQLRFRAVLLTSLTTIMGLLPLLLERSLQAQVLIPLVTSLIFGLLASTFLILIFIPALYSIMADFKLISKANLN